tara:strand:- start:310 stop:555 length:246 start_codon:yes stop_codon:yes gene_type:complete
MKIEKIYKENEIKITRYAMKKTTTKQIMKCRTKAAFTSRAPSNVSISSIYNSNIKREAQTQQDGRSTNSMDSNRGRDNNCG